MNIKALITTLAIVGSSTAAMANPVTTRVSASARASLSWNFGSRYEQPMVRDHRSQQMDRWNNRPVREYEYEDDYEPRFVADDLSFDSTEYRKDVTVGPDRFGFNTIEIAADGGRTYVQKVMVEFADNTYQTIAVDRTISRNQVLQFDLNGSNRQIGRIFVYRADGDAALHMNVPSRGAFSVTAL